MHFAGVKAKPERPFPRKSKVRSKGSMLPFRLSGRAAAALTHCKYILREEEQEEILREGSPLNFVEIVPLKSPATGRRLFIHLLVGLLDVVKSASCRARPARIKNAGALERYFAIYLHYWPSGIFSRRWRRANVIRAICYSCYSGDSRPRSSPAARGRGRSLKARLDNDHPAEYRRRWSRITTILAIHVTPRDHFGDEERPPLGKHDATVRVKSRHLSAAFFRPSRVFPASAGSTAASKHWR